MSEVRKRLPIVQFNGEEAQRRDDEVIREAHVAIYINEKQVLSAPCLDSERELFIHGALYTQQGILPQDVRRIEWKGLTVFVHLEEGVRPAEPVSSICQVPLKPRFSAQSLSAIVEEFQQLSDLFRATGAVHVAALCTRDRIVHWYEDISRRTALDKVIGKWLLNRAGISSGSSSRGAGTPRPDSAVQDLFLLTSGRISSDIIMRAVRIGVPLMVSVAPPSDKAVEIAHKHRLTLIGFARPPRMNVYSHSIRIS